VLTAQFSPAAHQKPNETCLSSMAAARRGRCGRWWRAAKRLGGEPFAASIRLCNCGI